MSSSFGDDAVTESSTLKGRDWPCLRQFGVFLENRVGLLHELLRHIERDDLRVIGMSVVDTVDCAIARMILSDYERAKELLDLATFPYFEVDIIGVQLPDDPKPYLQVCTPLMRAEVNIHYTYPLLYRRRGRGGIAIYVDDTDQALRILKENGLTIITESDLLNDDEYL